MPARGRFLGIPTRVTVTLSSVGADLVWRLGEGSRIVVDLLPWATPSGDLVIPLVSVFVGVVAARSIASITTWLIFLVAFIIFIDKVYPDQSGVPTTDRGFQALFAVFALALALSLDGATNLWTRGPILGFLIVSAMAAFVGYLQIVSFSDDPWDALEPTDRALRPAQYLTSEDIESEIETDLQRSGVLGVLGTGLWLAALGVLLVFPCFFAAILAVTLAQAYPLPDILMLVWAGYALVDRSPGVDLPNLPRRAVDIETRLFEGTQQSLESLKGMVLTLYVIFGAFGAAGLFWAGSRIISVFLPSFGIILQTRPLLAWNVVGVALVLLLAGIHSLWFWVREFRRLDRFLSYYENQTGPTGATTRVVGWTGPALLAAVTGVSFVAGVESKPILVAIGTIWPLIAAGIIIASVRTSQKPHEDISQEDRVILIALLVQTIAILTLGEQEAVEMMILDGNPTFPFTPIIPLSILLTALTFLDDVSRYSDNHDDLRRFTLPGFFLFLGVSIVISSVLTSGWLQIALWMIAGTCTLGAMGLAITRYYNV